MIPKIKGRSSQRRALLDLLMSTEEHPTAAEVARGMAAKYGPVSLSNLYRNLDILVASGHVRRLRLDGGPDRFDANLKAHYHVTCIHCQRVWDMPLGPNTRWDLPMPPGFQPQASEVTIKGCCASCAAAPNPFSKEV